MNAHLLKLSYPCIFCKSSEEAAQRLFQLISNRECGFDEGPVAWRAVIETMLDNELDIQSLNYHGTDFPEKWWVNTLNDLLAKISAPAAK